LGFFARVSLDDPDPRAYGATLKRGEPVVVEDVTKSELFAGTPALEIFRAAGVCALQSTPLTSRDGAFMGMLTTLYRSPHEFDERDSQLLDLLARQAAAAIERTRDEETGRRT